MPFLSGYTKRKLITIDHTYVDSDLTDFPLLVKFTDDADIGADIDSNGYNIRFTSNDGTTLLKYERQDFDNGGSTATGIFWVKVPTIAGSSNTEIYIYYKASSPSDGEDAGNVWDSSYKAVMHLGDNPTGSSNDIIDSTSNNNHGTSTGSLTSAVSGKVGDALTFDGSNDYILLTHGFVGDWYTGTPDLFFSIWFKTATHGVLFGQQSSNNPFSLPSNGYVPAVYIDTNGKVRPSIFWHNATTPPTSTTTVTDDNWHNVTVKFSGGTESLYIDGVYETGSSSLSQVSYHTNYDYFLGVCWWSGWYNISGDYGILNGELDEFRFAAGSGAAKSDAYIKFTYHNISESDNELTFSSEESAIQSLSGNLYICGHVQESETVELYLEASVPYLSGYLRRKRITIDPTYVDSNLTDFPLLIKFTDDADIGANIDSNGYNIRFTEDDGETLLKYERQSFDNGGSTATGIFWVKIPTISDNANTYIYLYYKSDSPSDGEDATNTWDSNFVAVYHLEQDPSGSAPQILDSTANNNDGTSSGSVSSGALVTGKVGSGLDLDGTDDEIQCLEQGTTNHTYECIVNIPTGNQTGAFIKNGGSARGYGFGIGGTSFEEPGRNVVFLRENLAWHHNGSITYTDGMHHVVFRADNSNNNTLFIDGADSTLNVNGSFLTVNSGDLLYIGGYTSNIATNRHWGHLIDEVRVSNVVRSDAWVKFTYRNIFETDNEISFSSEEFNTGSSDSINLYIYGHVQESDSVDLYIEGPSDAAPYLIGYTKRKLITIDNTYVDGNLTDFPLLVKFTDDADIGADIDSNGYNIRFTSSDGETLLKYERQSFDNSGSTATGIFWVKVPTVNGSSDTEIYIYYKSSGPVDGQDATNVWDSNYAAVYHLEQDPSGGAPQILDSTGNNVDGTSAGSMTSGDLITSQVGNGLDFDGSDDNIGFGSVLSQASAFTIEAIANPTSGYGTNPMVVGRTKFGGDYNQNYMLFIRTDVGDDEWGFQVRGSNTDNEIKGGSITTGVNSYLAAVFIDASTMKLRYNGSQIASGGNGTSPGTTDCNFYIGAYDSIVNNWKGTIDEVRISSIARSDNWLKFVYHNIFEADNEIAFSEEELKPAAFLSGYSKRKLITVDHTYIDSDLTDFPLLVKFTDDADIGANIDSNGYNIRFTTTDGTTLLKYERQSFDNTGNTATGIFWVKIPTLAGSTNTDIYVYYKSSSPSDGQDITNTWNSGFAAVYHMEEDPSGSAPQILDSTSNNNDLSSTGAIASGDTTSGKVGYGLDFNGSNDYLVKTSPTGIPGATETSTLSLIAKLDSITNNNNSALIDLEAGGGGKNLTFQIASVAGTTYVATDGVVWSQSISGAEIPSTSVYHHLTLTHDGSGGFKYYLDGALTKSFSQTVAVGTISNLYIMARQSIVTGYTDGIADEARIENVERSADWIKFVYHNIFETDNELIFSSEETQDTSDIMPMYVYGLDISSGNIPLYTYGYGTDSGNFPMYISGVYSTSDNINLYIEGLTTPLETGTPTSGIFNLYTSGPPRTAASGEIPLFLWSTTNSGAFATTPLLTGYEEGYADPTHTMNLFLKTSEFGTYSTSFDLFLGHDTTTSSGVNLFLGNYWLENSGNVNLYMCAPVGTYGAVPLSGQMNLYIARTYEGMTASQNMYLKVNEGYNDYCYLSISGSVSSSSNINLYTKSYSTINSGLLLYNHGF
jgi:hypothetical protein